MRKLTCIKVYSVLIIATSLCSTPLLAQNGAVVTKDVTQGGYLAMSDQYVAVGATDEQFLDFLKWAIFGCEAPTDPPAEVISLHDVLTPSGNENLSIHGPAIHSVWNILDNPCADEPVAWGYGQVSVKVQLHKNGSFSEHDTASGSLYDIADQCEGDLVNFSVVTKIKNGNEKVNGPHLDCPVF